MKLLPLNQRLPDEQTSLTAAQEAECRQTPTPRAASSPRAQHTARSPSPPLPPPKQHSPHSPKSRDSTVKFPRALPSPARAWLPRQPPPHCSRPASLRRAEPQARGYFPPPSTRRALERDRERADGSKGAGPVGRTPTARTRRSEAAAVLGWGWEAADSNRDPAPSPTHRCSKMAEKEEAGHLRGIMGEPWARGGARRDASCRETWRPSPVAARARCGHPHWPRAANRTSGATPLPGSYSNQDASRRVGRYGSGKGTQPPRRDPAPAGGTGLHPPRS